jgi:hypothetical protein
MKTRIPTIAIASTFFALLCGMAIGNWLSENRVSENALELVKFMTSECKEDQSVIATADQSNWTSEQKRALATICEVPVK